MSNLTSPRFKNQIKIFRIQESESDIMNQDKNCKLLWLGFSGTIMSRGLDEDSGQISDKEIGVLCAVAHEIRSLQRINA